MKHIVVLSGAGMSADSGLKTFRDAGGLWEGYDVSEVATPEAWKTDPATVLDFYNQRRRQASRANPNEGHQALARLENEYEVTIITQNIDDLHERAGSSHVIHLHGELKKARSENDASLVYHIGDKPIEIGDTAEDDAQLRPHVVWFGEPVPNLEKAIQYVSKADIVIVIGTSLMVYPAAGLVDYAPADSTKFIIDPAPVDLPNKKEWKHLQKRAAVGTPDLVDTLLHTN